MGVPLFKREARGMELTPEGEFVFKHVRSLLAGVERMHGEVSGFASGLKGSVKLFATAVRSMASSCPASAASCRPTRT